MLGCVVVEAVEVDVGLAEDVEASKDVVDVGSVASELASVDSSVEEPCSTVVEDPSPGSGRSPQSTFQA